MELAHGGRGHSSSIDRYSHSSGRGGRGASRRSEYRGMVPFHVYNDFFYEAVCIFVSKLIIFGFIIQC